MSLLKPLSIARLFIYILILKPFATEAQVCRVTTSGQPLNSGATWDEPKSLNWALLDTQNCPEIWVKSGVYTQPHGASRSASFELQRGVKMYGGFQGTESSLDQRDPVNNKAVLSGDIGVHGLNTDNSFHVVNISTGSSINLGSTTTLDGFVIRDGYSIGSNGGGLVCDANGANTYCDPHLKNIEFINNTASKGGALYINSHQGGDSRPLIELAQFTNNQSLDGGHGKGGAIFVDADDGLVNLRLFDTEFIDNFSDGDGGALAMHVKDDSVSNLVIAQSTFVGNTAKNGGAFFSQVFGGSVFPQVKTDIYNATFHNNSSQFQGGAIVFGFGGLYLDNLTITGNVSGGSGGGMYLAANSNTYIRNTILWDNQATTGDQIAAVHANIYANNDVIQSGCSGFDVDANTVPSCQHIFTSNPLLGPLTNNNGFTQTRVPGMGGSAVDNGDNNTCIGTDQRGISRPQNGQCDVGSVELQTACRVTSNGTNNGNGSDWQNQAMTLQKALSVAYCPLVKIKTGTYYPTTSTDRSISFNIPAGVTVQGGYDGTAANENHADHEAFPVILSGDIGVPGDKTDNSYHVVKMNGHLGTKILPSTVLSGIEIHEGFGATGFFDFPNNSGAGLYCVGTGLGSECSPSLYDVKFVSNQALGGVGGGMLNDADNEGVSNPQLINVTFHANMAYNGGAMYNNGNNRGVSNPLIINGIFNSNAASNSGGAIYNHAIEGRSSGQYIFGHFLSNSASYGGAVYNSGQGLGSSNPSFTRMIFANNSATYDGGAMYSAGWNSGQSMPLIEDVTFQFNSAQRGGAMFLNDLAGNHTAQINRVTFDQNTATDGGAIYNDGENGFSHPQLTNVSFHYNQATANGGAIYNNGDNGASSPSLNHVTFKDNQAAYGAAMYSSAEFNGSSHASLRHVIMWNNTASQSGPTIYHNLAESSTYDSVIQYGCPTFGFGNANCDNIIEADPLLGPLVDNGGFTNTFLPAENSPAIDAGDGIFCAGEDQRNQARPVGASCDIGSIEMGVSAPLDVIFKDGFD